MTVTTNPMTVTTNPNQAPHWLVALIICSLVLACVALASSCATTQRRQVVVDRVKQCAPPAIAAIAACYVTSPTATAAESTSCALHATAALVACFLEQSAE